MTVMFLQVFLLCMQTPSLRGQVQYLASPLPVIPRPSSVTLLQGELILTRDVVIYSPAQFGNEAEALAKLLPLRSTAVVQGFDSTHADIVLCVDAEQKPEAYQLTVTETNVVIRASSASGAFYACQTLRQLLPPSMEHGARFDALRLRCMQISDSPRFQWRGAMLDCSRHFRSVEYIKRFLDLMALHKLNRFHWHLTDDQGWRLEIRSRPQLTAVGAWRMQSGGPYGGFYSQDDVRGIVAYAAKLHIEIIPEIDVPGHVMSAIAAYPELGCRRMPLAVPTDWGIFDDVLCISRESTYDFIRDVLRETAALFPSRMIHIGGDECPSTRWEECPDCSLLLHSVEQPRNMQALFSARLISMLDSLGKEPIGWNEILSGGVTANTVIQAWHGISFGVNAVRMGHRAIVSPHTHTYLNLGYDVLPLRRAYNFEPIPPFQQGLDSTLYLGIEANLWAESSPTDEIADYKLFPRLTALSEVAWSAAPLRDWQDFRVRLGAFGGRLRSLGVGFYADPAVSWDDGMQLTVDSVTVPETGTFLIHFSSEVDSVTASDTRQYELSVAEYSIYPARILSAERTDPHSVKLRLASADVIFPHEITLHGIRTPFHPWNTVRDSLSPDGLARFTVDPVRYSTIQVDVFPNPLLTSSGSSTISIKVTTAQPEPLRIRLYDALGRLRFTDIVEGGYPDPHFTFIPCGDLSPGRYLAVIQGSSGTITRPLILLR